MKAAAFTPPYESLRSDFRRKYKATFGAGPSRVPPAGGHVVPPARAAPPARCGCPAAAAPSQAEHGLARLWLRLDRRRRGGAGEGAGLSAGPPPPPGGGGGGAAETCPRPAAHAGGGRAG